METPPKTRPDCQGVPCQRCTAAPSRHSVAIYGGWVHLCHRCLAIHRHTPIAHFEVWLHRRVVYRATIVNEPVIIEDNISAGPERTVALRKLLEAKDAVVRAVVVSFG